MRQADEAREDRQKKGSSRSGKDKQEVPAFWTFHPTKAQREELKARNQGAEQALLVLAKSLERGIGISFGYSADRASSFVIARDKTAGWNQGTALSVWHSDLVQAVLGMAYVLTSVYPEYPEEGPGEATFIDEW